MEMKSAKIWNQLRCLSMDEGINKRLGAECMYMLNTCTQPLSINKNNSAENDSQNSNAYPQIILLLIKVYS